MSAVPMLLGPTTETLLAAERDSRAWIGPGLLGFLVIALLGVATYLLWRNMNKQIRKVDFDDGTKSTESTEGTELTEGAEPTEGADSSATNTNDNGSPHPSSS